MTVRSLHQDDPTPLCSALRNLIGWEATSREVWEHLEHLGVKGLPGSPSVFSYMLRTVAPYLLPHGVNVTFQRQRGRATIIRIDGIPSVKHEWREAARAKV